MIDFASITKTLDGLDCRYIHERESNGETIHVFTLFNEAGERFEFYNKQGKRLKWSGSKWELEQDGKWEIYKPKTVEIMRWVGLFDDGEGEYHVSVSSCEENLEHRLFIAKQQHTFRFEVPHD